MKITAQTLFSICAALAVSGWAIATLANAFAGLAGAMP